MFSSLCIVFTWSKHASEKRARKTKVEETLIHLERGAAVTSRRAGLTCSSSSSSSEVKSGPAFYRVDRLGLVALAAVIHALSGRSKSSERKQNTAFAIDRQRYYIYHDIGIPERRKRHLCRSLTHGTPNKKNCSRFHVMQISFFLKCFSFNFTHDDWNACLLMCHPINRSTHALPYMRAKCRAVRESRGTDFSSPQINKGRAFFF